MASPSPGSSDSSLCGEFSYEEVVEWQEKCTGSRPRRCWYWREASSPLRKRRRSNRGRTRSSGSCPTFSPPPNSSRVHNDQTSDELSHSGDLVELSSSVDLAVRRPGEAHAVLHGDLRPMRYWIGGGRVAVMDVSRWTYAVASVPQDLGAAIDQIWERYGMKIPLADFISDNPYEDLTRHVETGTYVGLHEIDGVSCHHLAFRQSDIDWQIWIEDGLLPRARASSASSTRTNPVHRDTRRSSRRGISHRASDPPFSSSSLRWGRDRSSSPSATRNRGSRHHDHSTVSQKIDLGPRHRHPRRSSR